MQPSIYQPPDYASTPFVVQFTPISFTNTLATYSVGSARATTNDWVMEYPGTIQNLPGQIVINTAVIGANGCFPVGLQAATPAAGLQILPVYILGTTSGTTDGSLNGLVAPAMVIATQSTGFVPVGYDVFKQVGFVLINSSGNLVPYAMRGLYNERYVMLQDAELALSAGTATTQTTVPLILGASGPYLPAEGIAEVNLQWVYTPNAATDILSLVPTGLTPQATTFPVQIKTNGTAVERGNVTMPIGEVAETINGVSVKVAAVDYKTTSGSDSVSLYVAGFTYTIPFIN